MRLSSRLEMPGPVVLDGGLSTALEELGHDLGDSLWSARLLDDQPEAIGQAHAAFADAGAEVVITATYQASIDGFVSRGKSRAEAEGLIRGATVLARQSVGERALVAASVGPYGAWLADGSEYRGDYGLTAGELRRWHSPRWELLVESGPDVMAVETIPSVREVEAVAPLIASSGVETWVSVSCRPGGLTNAGEDVSDVIRALDGVPNLVAIGVNCTHPLDVSAALRQLADGTELPLITYPNLGKSWDSTARSWRGDAGDWLDGDLVDEWLSTGVRIVGGCCGTAPADIRRLALRVVHRG